MKNKLKNVTAIVISMLMISAISACSNTDQAQTPNPDTAQTTTAAESKTTDTQAAQNESTAAESSQQESAVGGDESADFYQPGNRVLDNIPVSLMKLRDDDEVTKWINSHQDFFENAPDSIEDYANVYSFITSFNITKEEAGEALKYELESDDPQIRITEEEFDTLFCGDLEKITKTFASEYSIVLGKNIYSPHWIYSHSVSDYEAAGLTPEMIEEKTEKYSDLIISDTEKEKFSEKLSQFTSKDIKL